MLDNVEHIMYIKFQKILMTGCRDMDKKDQKCSKNGSIPLFENLQDFFQKSGSVTFLHLWYPNFMQNKTKYTMDPGIYFLMKKY